MLSTYLNRSSKRKERRGREARRRLLRPLGLEALEERRLFDAGGNTLAAATDLGLLQGGRAVSDYVGPADRDDYFRFGVGGQAPVEVRPDQLSADADLTLLNASGGVIRSSTFGGNSPETISVTLAPGTYFVRVYPYGTAATNYRLTLSSTPAPPDYAGNSMSAARDVGTLSGTQTYSDFVGQADPADWYHFRLGTGSDFHLRMDGMAADADVQLVDSGGRVIAGSYFGGSNAEAVDRVLAAGDYFVQVVPFGSANTNYRLSLQATPSGPPDGAGNSMAQARDLGTISFAATVNDFVGQADTADYYRFRVATRSEVHLRMDGMSADADVRLLDSSGRVISGSYNGGANPEAVDAVIEGGDYYLQVYPWGSANTNYRLAIATAPFLPPMDVTTMTPVPDYAGHVGADYMAPEGTPVLSPVGGRVIAVQPKDGYGTMAVAIEVTLPTSRTFVSEFTGRTVTTNRVIVVFGHLRPSRNLVASSDAWYRFNTGSGELGYRVGDTISAGQRLGYLEAQGYNGSPAGAHAHVTISDAVNPPPNYWQGRGLPEDNPLRARYIRPELAWSLLR